MTPRTGLWCCPLCAGMEREVRTLLPLRCRLFYERDLPQSNRRSGRCPCGWSVRSPRVLTSPQHLELAASQLVVDGHVPAQGMDLATILLARFSSVRDVIEAVQDTFNFRPAPGVPTWLTTAPAGPPPGPTQTRRPKR